MATQSTPVFKASLAVDGDTPPYARHEHCAGPDAGWGYRAWWMVDLGQLYVIYNVSLWGECEYAQYTQVTLPAIYSSGDLYMFADVC